MCRLGLIAAVVAALALGAGVAPAKPKPKGISVTVQDIQVCSGASGSSPEEQVPVCTKIINSGKVKHPYESDYYATRGAAYFALKQLDKALADLNKAIGIRQSPEFYFQRALIQMANRNTDAAKTDLAEVMKLKPEFSPSYFMRGLISFQGGEYAEAAKYFDGAVQRLPTYYQAIYARGVAKKKAGDESGGDRDIKDARGMSSHVEEDMKQLGLTP